VSERLPPLQSLLAFEAAARLGGITKAAQELSLTQSAITHQIHNLESWVGQPLFNRVGRGVKLSAAGELFSKTVATTLDTLREGRKRIEPYRNMDSVLLACPTDFAAGWLIPRLPALRALHPTLEIWLITRDEIREIDRIDVDLIISSNDLSNDTMVSQEWLPDHAHVVAAPAIARRLARMPLQKALQAAPLIIDEHASAWAPWLTALEVPTQRAITLEDAQLRIAAAENGLGLALVSHLISAAARSSGRVAVVEGMPTVTMASQWLSKSRFLPRSPAVDIVYAWLAEQTEHS
jgi:LysR family glycine cleavage system transcriptional activator